MHLTWLHLRLTCYRFRQTWVTFVKKGLLPLSFLADVLCWVWLILCIHRISFFYIKLTDALCLGKDWIFELFIFSFRQTSQRMLVFSRLLYYVNVRRKMTLSFVYMIVKEKIIKVWNNGILWRDIEILLTISFLICSRLFKYSYTSICSNVSNVTKHCYLTIFPDNTHFYIE